ncbi:uncharacterized protein G2W53_021666 [Senna tora]|uniref:Uncharacterized protein n=1 Tax=Senna tora TaxID=362788 RepID=A0A834WI31_9FABA|nr:uncharacterized protein G2W53_021666 [Senna tora]
MTSSSCHSPLLDPSPAMPSSSPPISYTTNYQSQRVSHQNSQLDYSSQFIDPGALHIFFNSSTAIGSKFSVGERQVVLCFGCTGRQAVLATVELRLRLRWKIP